MCPLSKYVMRIPMTDLFVPSLLSPLFSSAAMRSIVDDRARLQRMLDFEAALARAEAAVGIIPAEAVEPIANACKAEQYDIAALAAAAPASGNVLIPLVQALTQQVTATNTDAARWIHWGATSQDVIDTAQALELRAGIDALLIDLDRAITAFLSLAGRYRRTPTVARTLMQHALPMPFGLKVASYASALARSRERLRRLRREALMLQFGGAAGTLAALGDRGIDVSERLGAMLNLPLPDSPWHSHRDRFGEVASALTIMAGTCGKIARDVTLLMQTDVAEVFEPAATGRGGSSSMPHKRNPVASTTAIAAATIAPQLAATILAAEVQEHERAAGAWQAEWLAFPSLLLVVSGGLASIADIAEGLEIDPERMRANLDASRGQVMAEAVSVALGVKLGKTEAHRIVEEACRKASTDKLHLQQVLSGDERVKAHLSDAELTRLFDPFSYQGVAQLFIERIVATIQGRTVRR